MYSPRIEVLNQEIDPKDSEPSQYRMLVDRTHFKYITIDTGTYSVDELCFPPVLLELLPPFPIGDWNYGRIGKTMENPSPHFIKTVRETLPSITPLWHPKSYDYLSFEFGASIMPNVYPVISPQFNRAAHRQVRKILLGIWVPHC